MSIISYMGTKEALAGEIAATFSGLQPGPLLDLFAGMSAIGRAAAESRNIWVNDVQRFSQLVSEFQFTNGGARGDIAFIEDRIVAQADLCARDLLTEFAHQLAREDDALQIGNVNKLIDFENDIRSLFKAEDFNGLASQKATMANYRLFTDRFASAYFGVRQCIQIDALRYGIDVSLPANEPHYAGLRRRALAALGAAVSRCSNSTGHFAQYLTANVVNVKRVAAQRRRSVVEEWKLSLRNNKPVGNSTWRRGNRVFSSDACSLLDSLRYAKKKPAIVYADPPYTSDQYSRYYHILETLLLYDHPIASSKGRYRADRFVSAWSLKTKVQSCFEELIDLSSQLGASLVISYPENGLLQQSDRVLPVMLRERYKSVRRLNPVHHQHSTMGASKGAQRNAVLEQIFVAS